MILVDHQLRTLLPEIIKPFDESLVGPNSYDLRLDDQFKVFTYKDIMPIADYNFDPKAPDDKFYWKPVQSKQIILAPKQFILASTVEYFDFTNFPSVCADVVGKSTIARTGLGIELAGFIDSGFKGNITLEIVNNLPCNYVLYANQLIAQLRVNLCNAEPDTPYGVEHTYQGQTGPTEANTQKIYRFCK